LKGLKMRKNLIQTLLFIIVLSLCAPLAAHALMWNYSGASQVTNAVDGSSTDAQITVTMSDQIVGWETGTVFDPSAGDVLPDNQYYYYPVTSWQMNFAGGPTYQGAGGGLTGFSYESSTPGKYDLLFDSLDLNGNTSSAYFNTHDPLMLNTDQSVWDYKTANSAQYAQLGPVLKFAAFSLDSSDGLGGAYNFANFDFSLTRSATPVNPVPEPLTIVLMGIGVAGVIGSARRRQARGLSA
jgi:hypothetical protein